MKDTQALKPSMFNIASFRKDEDVKEAITDEENYLSALKHTPGWKILNDFSFKAINELDEFNSEAISNGMSFEEIGKNTVIISLAKEIVRKILNKVNDASDAVEQNGK